MLDLMTVEEVAAYLRVNKKTIYRLLMSGKIPAARVGHQWRFDKSSIESWVQKSTAKAKILAIIDEEIVKITK